MLGRGDRLSTQGRNPMRCRQLRHPVSDQTHRHDKNRVRKLKESLAERTTARHRPVPGQLTATRPDDTLAKTNEVQVCRREVILIDDPS